MTPTNKPRGFHVPFPRRFNVESTWCVLLLLCYFKASAKQYWQTVRLGQPALIFLAGTKKSSTPKFYFKTLKFIKYFISQFQNFKMIKAIKKLMSIKELGKKLHEKIRSTITSPAFNIVDDTTNHHCIGCENNSSFDGFSDRILSQNLKKQIFKC